MEKNSQEKADKLLTNAEEEEESGDWHRFRMIRLICFMNDKIFQKKRITINE